MKRYIKPDTLVLDLNIQLMLVGSMNIIEDDNENPSAEEALSPGFIFDDSIDDSI